VITMKVFVRVKGAYEYTKKKNLRADGTIEMVKDKGKKTAWIIRNVDQGAIVIRKGRLGTKHYVDVLPNAAQPIRYHRDMKPEDIPVFDKKTSTTFINAKVLKRMGEEPQKQQSNTALWVIAIMVGVNIFLTLLATGRIRIG